MCIRDSSSAFQHNKWFTKEFVLLSLNNWSIELTENNLKKWINKFAELIDENGDKSKLVQSVFYPIPTVENRINSLKTSPSYCFGNISRQNLFLRGYTFFQFQNKLDRI